MSLIWPNLAGTGDTESGPRARQAADLEPESLNWAHTLEAQKGVRGWKRGNQQVRRMRKPKEKQVCLPSLSDLRAERTLTEINQELRLQLAKYKQDFRDLTEKFLISQATAYSLANQLQKYKCEACKDIVESVLGEKLLFEVRRSAEKPAEKQTLDERLRTCDTLIRSQARELTQLRQTLQHGKDDSVLLKQHLKDLLTHNDQGSHQGQGFRERLSEGYRLAERIACKLSPEIHEDEDDEQAQEKLTPSMELQEVEKREVPEDSKDECGLMPSILQASSDSHQPYSNDKFKFNDLEVDLGQDGACGCSHAKEEEIPTNVSDNENYHKPMSGQELPFPSVNLQDDEKKVVFQQSQDECVSVPSTLQEGSACNQPYSDGKFAFDEENVASAVDEACGCSHAEEDEIPTGLPENQNDHDDMKRPEVVAPRFSRQLPQMRENGVPRDSPDKQDLTYSVLPGLSDSFWPYRSNAIFSLEDVDVSYARDVTKNLADLEDEEDQDIISSSVEQLVVEENEVQPDSLDECYLAASVGHHLAGSCHPYRSASFPTERREVCLALDVNGDTWEDCHWGPVSFPESEVPTSQAQLQKSTPETDCLQWQLDQRFDCGDSKAMLGLSSTIWDLTSTSDSGNQGPVFLELGASISMKNPPKLEGEGSTASTHEHPVCNKIKGLSVLRQKGIRRKPLFGKWSLACRFPGLQATCDTLIQSQARELTQLRQTLQHGKDDSVLLKQHLKDLLTHNDQGSHQGQGFRERLSEGYRLAERIACKLSPEIYEDEDDEQAQEKLTPRFYQLLLSLSFSFDSSLVQSLLKPEGEAYGSGPKLDHGPTAVVTPLTQIQQSQWLPTAPPEWSHSSTGFSPQGEISQGDNWENCYRGPVSFPGSEVPASQAQLQKSTHVTDFLQWQLDQRFDCGDSKAMLGLSSTIWGFTSTSDSGNHGPLCLEPQLGPHTGNTESREGMEERKSTGLEGEKSQRKARTPIPSPLRITLDVVTDGNTLHLDCSCGFHLSKCGIHLYEAPDLDKGQNVRPHSKQKIDLLKAFAESHTPTIIKLCTQRTVWGCGEEKLS
ncbi:hypothetical protein MG293_001423 [Ovis ammon polii]|uniref:Olduvai domain-containing protein n=1 Tax=Ovis ammon polii TaxID=230172 RepID=A0AAD4UKY6_OVIAM|nr:hypothetical protein MG293_001423 [Ovis ammon polii]